MISVQYAGKNTGKCARTQVIKNWSLILFFWVKISFVCICLSSGKAIKALIKPKYIDFEFGTKINKKKKKKIVMLCLAFIPQIHLG